MRRIRGLLIGYAVIVLATGWPIASVVAAGLVASWNGCVLNEGNAHPCVVAGRDIGGTLYAMGVMGWFMLATIPLGVMAVLLWTVGWLIWYARRQKAAQAQVPGH